MSSSTSSKGSTNSDDDVANWVNANDTVLFDSENQSNLTIATYDDVLGVGLFDQTNQYPADVSFYSGPPNNHVPPSHLLQPPDHSIQQHHTPQQQAINVPSTSSGKRKRAADGKQRISKASRELESLEVQEADLRAENEQLRELVKQVNKTLPKADARKEELVKKLANAARRSSKTVPKHLRSYLDKYGISPDKWDRLETMIQDILSKGHLNPTFGLKMMLYALLQDNSFYNSGNGNDASLWGLICDTLEAEPKQAEALKGLRVPAKRLAKQLEGAKRHLEKAMSGVTGAKHVVEGAKVGLFEVLTEIQRSKLVAFVEQTDMTKNLIKMILEVIGMFSQGDQLPYPPTRVFDPDYLWESEAS